MLLGDEVGRSMVQPFVVVSGRRFGEDVAIH